MGVSLTKNVYYKRRQLFRSKFHADEVKAASAAKKKRRKIQNDVNKYVDF